METVDITDLKNGLWMDLPVSRPLVMTHAPVVLAALNKPRFTTEPNLAWSGALARPPNTEMTRLGTRRRHSRSSSCTTVSGGVS